MDILCRGDGSRTFYGAFDGVIARRVLESDRVHFRFPIVPAYLILGACAAFFWILFPILLW